MDPPESRAYNWWDQRKCYELSEFVSVSRTDSFNLKFLSEVLLICCHFMLEQGQIFMLYRVFYLFCIAVVMSGEVRPLLHISKWHAEGKFDFNLPAESFPGITNL
jgi:hypothetical protein